MTVEKVIKYNTEVWSNLEMDELRKTECLCLNCEIIKECSTAKKLYDLSVSDNIAMMITRCPIYEAKK